MDNLTLQTCKIGFKVLKTEELKILFFIFMCSLLIYWLPVTFFYWLLMHDKFMTKSSFHIVCIPKYQQNFLRFLVLGLCCGVAANLYYLVGQI